MSREDSLGGWYYKKDGQTFGPVSPLKLQELMASGQITPRQAVWKRVREGIHFVTAATAVTKEIESVRL